MMLETLLKLLSVGASSPEIMIDEDGDLWLEWEMLSAAINANGKVNWAMRDPTEHGTSIERLMEILGQLK